VSVFGVFALLPQLKRLRNIGVAVVIVAGILLLSPEGVFDRVGGLRYAVGTENLAAVDEEGSAEQRYAIWKVSWAIIRDNPLTGAGFGVYNLAHGAHAERVDPTRLSWGNRDAHSTYFNLAATVGVPGLMMFLGLIGAVFLHAEKARRRCRKLLPRTAQQLFFLQMGMVGFLVAGVFASYGRISFLYLHMALIYAVAQACNDDIDRLARQSPTVLRSG
jgi:O-antigen ligase